MNDWSAVKDRAAARRFDRRVRLLLAGLFLCFLPLFLLHLPTGNLAVHLTHLTAAALALLAFLAARDGVQALMLTSVFVMFSFLLYLNATLSTQTTETGLINPFLAAKVTLVSQGALTLVAILDRALTQKAPEIRGPGIEPDRFAALEVPLLSVGLLVVGLDAIGQASPMLTETARYLLPVPFVLALLRGTGGLPLAAGGMIFVLILIVSLRSNARADLLNLALLCLALRVLFAPRIITLLGGLVLYLVIRSIDVLSAVALAVRPLRDDPATLQRTTIDLLLSKETAFSLINPFHRHSAAGAYEQAQTDTVYSRSGFFGGDTSDLMDRLTLLPQMDMVTGRLPAPDRLDLPTLFRASLGSSLPDVGQQKLSILSDEIFWDLALRSRDSIGRPMITAQAEAWALGGLPAVFIATFGLFLIWSVIYRLIQKHVPFRSVSIVIGVSAMVYATMSTTLTSQALSLFRMPLQTIALLGAITLLIRWAGQTPRERSYT